MNPLVTDAYCNEPLLANATEDQFLLYVTSGLMRVHEVPEFIDS